MENSTASGPALRQTEAKRSIRYITRAVLEFGHVDGLADLLDRVARLCLATRYSPYNALLVLLQRPAATFVLPAHQWKERFGHVVRPGEREASGEEEFRWTSLSSDSVSERCSC